MVYYIKDARFPSVPIQILAALIDRTICPDQKTQVKIDPKAPSLSTVAGPTLRPPSNRTDTVYVDVRDGDVVLTIGLYPKEHEDPGTWRLRLEREGPKLWKAAQRRTWRHPDAGRVPRKVRVSIRHFHAYLHADRVQGRWSYFTDPLVLLDFLHFEDALRRLTLLGLLAPFRDGTAVERNVLFEIYDPHGGRPVKRSKKAH